MKIKQVILCSKSPRRAQLLQNITSNFLVKTLPVDEVLDKRLPLRQQIEQLALTKASALKPEQGQVIIGADTIVSYNGEIFGKPKDKDHAYQMLSTLSTKTHQVITGIALVSQEKTIVTSCVTDITFKKLSSNQINDYIATGSPLDKAGAFGIQDKSMDFIQSIDGDYFNVVGLPLSLVWEALLRLDPQYTPVHNDLA